MYSIGSHYDEEFEEYREEFEKLDEEEKKKAEAEMEVYSHYAEEGEKLMREFIKGGYMKSFRELFDDYIVKETE